jgi:histidinol dehydrogenase
MSLKDAIRDFFIEYEHEPPSNVVYLNTPHARAHAIANAAYAAQLDEQDRADIEAEQKKQAQIVALWNEKRHHAEEIERIDTALLELSR